MKQIIFKILLLSFGMLQVTAQAQAAGEKNNNLTIYTIAEESPEFPGGMTEMMKYIKQNTQVPEAVLENEKFYGCKVFIKFVVNEDGKTSDPEIIKGCIGFEECDKEALRLVESMPVWKPGRISGKPVKVYYNLPIIFKPE